MNKYRNVYLLKLKNEFPKVQKLSNVEESLYKFFFDEVKVTPVATLRSDMPDAMTLDRLATSTGTSWTPEATNNTYALSKWGRQFKWGQHLRFRFLLAFHCILNMNVSGCRLIDMLKNYDPEKLALFTDDVEPSTTAVKFKGSLNNRTYQLRSETPHTLEKFSNLSEVLKEVNSLAEFADTPFFLNTTRYAPQEWIKLFTYFSGEKGIRGVKDIFDELEFDNGLLDEVESIMYRAKKVYELVEILSGLDSGFLDIASYKKVSLDDVYLDEDYVSFFRDVLVHDSILSFIKSIVPLLSINVDNIKIRDGLIDYEIDIGDRISGFFSKNDSFISQLLQIYTDLTDFEADLYDFNVGYRIAKELKCEQEYDTDYVCFSDRLISKYKNITVKLGDVKNVFPGIPKGIRADLFIAFKQVMANYFNPGIDIRPCITVRAHRSKFLTIDNVTLSSPYEDNYVIVEESKEAKRTELRVIDSFSNAVSSKYEEFELKDCVSDLNPVYIEDEWVKEVYTQALKKRLRGVHVRIHAQDATIAVVEFYTAIQAVRPIQPGSGVLSKDYIALDSSMSFLKSNSLTVVTSEQVAFQDINNAMELMSLIPLGSQTTPENKLKSFKDYIFKGFDNGIKQCTKFPDVISLKTGFGQLAQLLANQLGKFPSEFLLSGGSLSLYDTVEADKRSRITMVIPAKGVIKIPLVKSSFVTPSVYKELQPAPLFHPLYEQGYKLLDQNVLITDADPIFGQSSYTLKVRFDLLDIQSTNYDCSKIADLIMLKYGASKTTYTNSDIKVWLPKEQRVKKIRVDQDSKVRDIQMTDPSLYDFMERNVEINYTNAGHGIIQFFFSLFFELNCSSFKNRKKKESLTFNPDKLITYAFQLDNFLKDYPLRLSTQVSLFGLNGNQKTFKNLIDILYTYNPDTDTYKVATPVELHKNLSAFFCEVDIDQMCLMVPQQLPLNIYVCLRDSLLNKKLTRGVPLDVTVKNISFSYPELKTIFMTYLQRLLMSSISTVETHQDLVKRSFEELVRYVENANKTLTVVPSLAKQLLSRTPIDDITVDDSDSIGQQQLKQIKSEFSTYRKDKNNDKIIDIDYYDVKFTELNTKDVLNSFLTEYMKVNNIS